MYSTGGFLSFARENVDAVAAETHATSRTVNWDGGWAVLFGRKTWGGLSAIALDVVILGSKEEL